jgi:hypothetical protein
MILSNRAKIYISNLKRDSNWFTDIDITKDYLKKNNIEPHLAILNFQSLYSGFELVIKNDIGHSFRAYLFSKKQILTNEPVEFIELNDRILFCCGDHKTAQFNFFLAEKGELCTIDNEEDKINILHSSFEKFIESYALKNEIYNWERNPHYFEIKDYDKLAKFLKANYRLIEECSDEFESWWTDDKLIIETGIWLDRPEYFVHVYGKNRLICDEFIENLKNENILK